MTAMEIWLLERVEPLYRIYPWKALLRAGSRGCSETDYGQNLMRKMMMAYNSEHKEYAKLAGFGYRMLAKAIKAPCLPLFHRNASVCIRGGSPATEYQTAHACRLGAFQLV